MRLILFRAKIKSGWVYGSLQYGNLYNFISRAEKTKDGYISTSIAIEKDNETVGQYTGMKDKNGNKIFEGDIILHTLANEKYIVVWKNGVGFRLQRINQPNQDDVYLSDEFCYQYAEIVGNIYDRVKTEDNDEQ